MECQKYLRLFIIRDESFPPPDDFHLTIDEIFERVVSMAIRNKCEWLVLDSGCNKDETWLSLLFFFSSVITPCPDWWHAIVGMLFICPWIGLPLLTWCNLAEEGILVCSSKLQESCTMHYYAILWLSYCKQRHWWVACTAQYLWLGLKWCKCLSWNYERAHRGNHWDQG